MNDVEQKELWRWAVHNRSFDIERDLTELRSTFLALSGERVGIFDKYSLVERQLRVCLLEADNLKKLLGAITFEPANAEVKGGCGDK